MTKAARARRPWMEMPATYGRVEELVRAGRPLVFVSGNAGTGKTTLVRYLVEVLAHRTVIVAPTGVAALNAGGVTVHSFFRFPPRMQDPGEVASLGERSPVRCMDLLVVDEVSMLRSDLMDGIDRALRKNRDSHLPFGGVQVLVVGDLFQLPPVVPSDEWEILAQRGYESPFFFSASVMRQVPLVHVELDQVYRQTDPAFVGLLNRLRTAEDIDATVDEINNGCPVGPADDHDITLTCTNRRADEINATSMAGLDTPEHLYRGEIDGRFRLERDKLPAPFELRLKVGARVMFTKNDEARRWVNGTSGVVVALSNEGVRVRVGDRSEREYDVEPVAWESFEYIIDRQEHRLVAHKVGEYRQYPLMPAWAVTIHKSQGKTLDRVLIDLGSGAFAAGQAYVALSRCRSLDRIRLARPLRASDVRCDPAVRRFYEALPTD